MLLIAIFALGLSSCETTGSASGGGSAPGLYAPSMMSQQIRMQQAHSRVTRSLIPF